MGVFSFNSQGNRRGLSKKGEGDIVKGKIDVLLMCILHYFKRFEKAFFYLKRAKSARYIFRDENTQKTDQPFLFWGSGAKYLFLFSCIQSQNKQKTTSTLLSFWESNNARENAVSKIPWGKVD